VVNANGHGPKLRPGILLLPEGPNGAKWGIDDFAANRDWGIDDFDSFIFPLPEVFDLETGRYEGETRRTVAALPVVAFPYWGRHGRGLSSEEP
jgi:hypothetical protein